jgi:ATP-dependent helicase HrpB
VKSGLPIDEALPALREALRSHSSAVLEAPTGAGKSTVVPLALLTEPWARGRRLLMLEPRRLAARAVAARMAATLGEDIGRTVGYRMRLDTRVSRDTRVEVVTEGVLTRLLQEDPALDGVAAVIFDEFHERSLQADLGLALALDARATLTPELRLLVMSATLETSAVAQLLGDAPVVSAPGRAFPIETRYAGSGLPALPLANTGARGGHSPEQLVAQLVSRALREEPGDVLVFLPGAAEIRRVQALLAGAQPLSDVTVLPLYGDLSGEAQDAALAPAGTGRRKVVLATNIAETSLTIPGVRVVVDSGLMRRARFDPVTGMSRLETERISRASAAQRQGRAGRTADGVCYRAWSEGAHAALAPGTAPEITDADLAPLALELASWGTRDASQLCWLDAPPAAMLASARDLLLHLGALDREGRITAHGRDMARVGTHPRLAHMLLRARALGALPLAAQLAALLSERDLLRGSAARDADIRTRLDVLKGADHIAASDRGSLARARRVARDLERQLAARAAGPRSAAAAARDSARAAGDTTAGADIAPGLLLAFAYPDRIGRRRAGGDGRFTLANGRGAAFAEPQTLARQELIVAVELDDRERDARILLAAPLGREELLEHFGERIRRRESVEWSSREQAVLARRTVELDALVLDDKPLPEIPAEAARTAMLAGVRELGIAALPWDREARDLQARIEFVRALAGTADPPWPAVSDEALLQGLDRWLAPWLEGVTRREHLARVPLTDALRAPLSFVQQRQLQEWAPTHLAMPSGSHIRVDYAGDNAPAVSVRLQEVFGLAATPRVGRGRVPVTLRLLSPAQRPVQVTRDLASFWRGAYAEVRKDLRGRYPKHYWPENPLEAQPTRGTRRPR